MYSSFPLEACVVICSWLGSTPNTQTCTGWLWDFCLGTHLFQYLVILPLCCQQIPLIPFKNIFSKMLRKGLQQKKSNPRYFNFNSWELTGWHTTSQLIPSIEGLKETSHELPQVLESSPRGFDKLVEVDRSKISRKEYDHWWF